ncbi:MAG: hypothetical protein IPM82_28395 [Saprospiraceae bacterium]|nr:hypothetical protein [Saprospiraceae bacterium]
MSFPQWHRWCGHRQRPPRCASLYTDPDVYQITLNGDYILHSANTIDYQEFEDVNVDFDYAKLTAQKFLARTTAWLSDLGLSVELGKLDLAASVLDLGKITWDDNVTNYVATQTYQYDGLDFSGALTGDSVSFGDALDTLKSTFKVEETSGSYTPPRLPAKFTLAPDKS